MTSPSEAAAAKTLARAFDATGNLWFDRPVVGNGNGNARTVVRARIFGGNPPTAAQWVLGEEVFRFARTGHLQPMQRPQWDLVLPSAIRGPLKTPAGYMAAPIALHGRNWLWLNKTVLEQAGATVPRSWREFDDTVEKIRQSGRIPLAFGGEPWQEYLVFESVVASVGGADFYRRALLDLDPSSLASPTMVRVFARMRRLIDAADPGFAGRSWDAATAMVINGRAGMQIMGDWAKGDMMAAGLQPGRDIDCVLVPESMGSLIFNTDVLLFPVTDDSGQRRAQDALADIVMNPAVQRDFSLAKGAVPVRLDADRAGFDNCARQDMATMADPARLLPASDREMTEDMVAAAQDVVTQFVHFPLAPEVGVALFAQTVAAHR